MPLFKSKDKRPARKQSLGARLFQIAVPAVILGLPLYWFVGVHNDYYARQRAFDATAYARQVAQELSKGYAKDGKLPSMGDVKTKTPRPPELKSLELRENRTLRVHVADMDEGEDTLDLVGSLDASNQLKWTCVNVNLEQGHIPRNCQPQ